MTSEVKDYQKKKYQLWEIIRDKRLAPVYQPIVSLKTGAVLGYEALSRIALPDCMFHVEEMFALAGDIGIAWELEEICREKSIRGARGRLCGKKLFLNVSPEIVKNEKFKKGVTAEYLRENDIRAEDIIFEITERTAITDTPVFMAALEHYQKQNYKIAIDDMGNGYAGLNRVCRIEPDYVKVDMELVRDIDRDYLKESIVESFVRFCGKTGIHLIAEGIETAEELRTLIKIGVEYGQGYFLQRPSQEISETLVPEIVSIIQHIHEKKRRHQLMPSFFGSAATVCTSTMTVSPEALGHEVYRRFEQDEDLTECCVVDRSGAVQGVLTRAELFKRFGGRYGFSLSGRHRADELADKKFLVVEADTSIETVSKLALKRRVQKRYDAVIITEDGTYKGVATVKNLLEAAISIQVKRAVDANPLTGLPGNKEIEKRVRDCMQSEEPFSITYLDLDNFKAYNDAYGFNNGDQMIRLLANLAEETCGEDMFLGHIGGDDFVVVAHGFGMEEKCRHILSRFEEEVTHLYSRKDLEKGCICAKNRNGFEDIFPIASVSIAVITNRRHTYDSIEQLSKTIACTKKQSKLIKGNSYVET